jgi:ATP-dependent Clp protease ATP-binding subunit ClpA
VDEETAVRIVSALKGRFESFHRVKFADGAVEAAVHASGFFLPDRHLPDRAIDLIDEAAVTVRLQREKQSPGDASEAPVTREDIHAAAAARAGLDTEAVKRVLQAGRPGEVQRTAAQLAAAAPEHAGAWIPLLATYLAHCTGNDAEALAQAIRAAKSAPDE